MLQTKIYRISCVFLSFLLCSLLVGCGGGNVKVSGKISLSDGTPVTGGRIVFVGEVTQGKGAIDKDGNYSLSFDKKNNGVPPGTYKVVINGAFFTPANTKTEDEMDTGTRPMVDLKYAEVETTPLTCTVPGDGYDFTVEPSAEYAKEKGL